MLKNMHILAPKTRCSSKTKHLTQNMILKFYRYPLCKHGYNMPFVTLNNGINLRLQILIPFIKV